MNISEYFHLRKEAFELLKEAAPERPITMPMLLKEIENLLRARSA